MSKISALADYLQETAIQKFAIGEASSVIPVEDRIYLNAEGLIPNVNKKPRTPYSCYCRKTTRKIY